MHKKQIQIIQKYVKEPSQQIDIVLLFKEWKNILIESYSGILGGTLG